MRGRALGGKRGYCSVGAVHGGEGDDPILAPQGPATVKTLTRHWSNDHIRDHPHRHLRRRRHHPRHSCIRRASAKTRSRPLANGSRSGTEAGAAGAY